MAGSRAMIVCESENMIPTTTRSEWMIQYARFFTYPSSSDLISASTCTGLNRRRVFYKPNLTGTWISTSSSAASLQLSTFDHSVSDLILTVSLDGKVLEEHFLFKLKFTWPHVSCVSGFPSRGSKVVFGSYVDSTGEVHKFALRFSSTQDSEEFTNAMKPHKENAAKSAMPSHDTESEFFGQSEFVQSLGSPYRPCVEFNVTTPMEPSRIQMHYSLDYEVDQLPSSLQIQLSQGNAGKTPYSLDDEIVDIFEDAPSGFPPSFTSLLTNCISDVDKVQPMVYDEDESDFKSQIKRLHEVQRAVPAEDDFKSQVAKYMDDSSFIDMLGKVEKVVSELGDDLLLSSSSIKLH